MIAADGNGQVYPAALRHVLTATLVSIPSHCERGDGKEHHRMVGRDFLSYGKRRQRLAAHFRSSYRYRRGLFLFFLSLFRRHARFCCVPYGQEKAAAPWVEDSVKADMQALFTKEGLDPDDGAAVRPQPTVSKGRDTKYRCLLPMTWLVTHPLILPVHSMSLA